MRILKEVKETEKTFDWEKSQNFLSMFPSNTKVDESLMNEDKYTEISEGTCFKLPSKPAVYIIDQITTAGQVIFSAYGHDCANHWRTSLSYLSKLLANGDITLLSEQEKKELYSYHD